MQRHTLKQLPSLLPPLLPRFYLSLSPLMLLLHHSSPPWAKTAFLIIRPSLFFFLLPSLSFPLLSLAFQPPFVMRMGWAGVLQNMKGDRMWMPGSVWMHTWSLSGPPPFVSWCPHTDDFICWSNGCRKVKSAGRRNKIGVKIIIIIKYRKMCWKRFNAFLCDAFKTQISNP